MIYNNKEKTYDSFQYNAIQFINNYINNQLEKYLYLHSDKLLISKYSYNYHKLFSRRIKFPNRLYY